MMHSSHEHHASSHDSLRTLIRGVKRYESVEQPRYHEHFASLAHGQAPLALFIGCADSRVMPSLITLSDPGQLFVVRNVANLIAPFTADREDEIGSDASVPAAVFYALDVLNVRDVIVCGHSGCGGMKALLEPSIPTELTRWLASGLHAVDVWREKGPLDPSDYERPAWDQLSQVSTVVQTENLMTYDFVRERVKAREVRLHAWWFDIARGGQLLGYSKDENRFIRATDALEEADVTRAFASALDNAAE